MSFDSLQDSLDDFHDTLDDMGNFNTVTSARAAVEKLHQEVAVEQRIFDNIYPQTIRNMFGKSRKARDETRILWSRIVGAARSVSPGNRNNLSSPEYLRKLSAISNDLDMPLVQDIKRRSIIWQLVPNDDEQDYLHKYLESSRYPKGWTEQLLRYMIMLDRDEFPIAKVIVISMEGAKNGEVDAETLESLVEMPFSHIFAAFNIELSD